MPLDGITTHFLALELNSLLAGGRIDRVYQPDRYDVILHIRQESQNFRLLLSANPSGPRIHITSSSRENPALPPSFCMLLRKHLAGSRITSITSPSFERIVEIAVQSVDELGDRKDKRLIIEMMGRYSNVILVNTENRIFDSLLHVDSQMSRVREVMPARPYAYPPVQGKLPPDEASAMLLRGELPVLQEAAGRPLEKALQESLLGFSPLLSREICFLSGVDGRKGLRQLLPAEKEAVIRAALDILGRIMSGSVEPGTYAAGQDAQPKEFHALLLRDAGFRTAFDTISAAIDAVYRSKDMSVEFDQKKRNLLQFCQTSLQHALRRKNIHENDIFACRDMNQYQKYGQLLLANAWQIPSGSASYAAVDYESEDLSLIEVPMDSARTVAQNAQDYFRQYTKCKSRLEAASDFLEEDNRAVEYLSSLHEAIESASEKEDLEALREEMELSGLLGQGNHTGNGQNCTTRKSRPEKDKKMYPGKAKSGGSGSRALRAAGKAASMRAGKGTSKSSKAVPSSSSETGFRRYTTADGTVILCGRNNIQNDLLTMKTAAPDDLWFHVQKMPGTHVVLRCGKQEPSQATILQAAQTAAYFSRTASRAEKNKASDPRQSKSESADLSELKIAVDYCPVKNVRKPAKAKPGMVIYEHYRTVLVSPEDPAKSR